VVRKKETKERRLKFKLFQIVSDDEERRRQDGVWSAPLHSSLHFPLTGGRRVLRWMSLCAKYNWEHKIRLWLLRSGSMATDWRYNFDRAELFVSTWRNDIIFQREWVIEHNRKEREREGKRVWRKSTLSFSVYFITELNWGKEERVKGILPINSRTRFGKWAQTCHTGLLVPFRVWHMGTRIKPRPLPFQIFTKEHHMRGLPGELRSWSPLGLFWGWSCAGAHC